MLDFTNTDSFNDFQSISVEPNGFPNELDVCFSTSSYDVKLTVNVKTKDYDMYDYCGSQPFEDISDDIDQLVDTVIFLQNKVA